jgi:hypothetical protein
VAEALDVRAEGRVRALRVTAGRLEHGAERASRLVASCESVERSAAARSVGDSGSGGAGEACGEEDVRRVV